MNKMKVLHGACSRVHSNKLNKGTIKIFNTTYIKVLQFLLRECFPWIIKSDMELHFNLNTFNACCIQVHKTKYSMTLQYPTLGILEIVWAPYHIFYNWRGIV
jgi:hypothetical protein